MIDVKFSQFFDRAEVQKHVKDGTSSALSKFGAYVRRSAKGLIRAGKKSAKAGSPPKSHVGTLKDLIFFGYDAKSESVVIGPQLFSGKSSRGNPTVPNLLEFGGTTTSWKTGKAAVYQAHPYMKPAYDANESKLPDIFSGCVKG